jgi:hypothetical protein
MERRTMDGQLAVRRVGDSVLNKTRSEIHYLQQLLEFLNTTANVNLVNLLAFKTTAYGSGRVRRFYRDE